MKFICASCFVILICSSVAFGKSGDVTELRIGVKHKPESCEIQAHKGDRVEVHYKGHETESARYISKPYFEKYGVLDDLQFDNFVRDEISLSSCVDEQPDVPKLTSLQRNLIGEGSHRRLSSVIRLEFEFSKSFCEVIIVEKLPSGVFADPFELQHLVQRSVFNDAAVFGDTNLELPSFRSNRSLVEIHVELNFDNLSAKNKQLELKIQLPLHARYAPLGQGFETIKFGNPTIFLRGCRKESDSDQSCMVEPVADYSSKSKSVHIAWEVPCGSKEHAGIVSFVTFMSAIVSAFLIVLTSLRHSNFMVSDAAK